MNTVLVLRTSNARRQSHNGFQWPESGPVEAPDWDPSPICGRGLHGLLWGEGDGSLLNWSNDAVWQVVQVDAGAVVDLGGKVKFPRGEVVYSGSQRGATDYIAANGGAGRAIVGSTVTGGDRSTVTGGYDSTVTGGDRSTVTGGYDSTVTGGYDSTVTGGDGSTVTGGDYSTVTGGYYSTVTGGDYSTVTGGDGSTVTGGDGSVLLIFRWDRIASRCRVAVAYVGEGGVMPGVAYRLGDTGNFVRADGKEVVE